MTTTPRTTITAAVLGLGAAVLTSCGTAVEAGEPQGRGHQGDPDRLAAQAVTYAGDPWEFRYRRAFWLDQHVHDSWNPCHIGENVPKALQGSGKACWSRLPGHTGR